MHRFLQEDNNSKIDLTDIIGEDYRSLDEILTEEQEEKMEKETLPHMELHRQRLETGVVSNFLIRDSGVKFPCLILEGITESCTVKNLSNTGLLSLSENEDIPKVTMYFRIENKVMELRNIDYNLENITVLKGLDKNLIMSYYESEDLPPKSPSIEDLLKMEVIEL